MKFLIVAVFCAHFAVAFTQAEFNLTISSRLTGKMENTDDDRDKIQAPRIDLVRIQNRDENQICQGILLDKNSIAMTEACSYRLDIDVAYVVCTEGLEKSMYLKPAMDKNFQKIRGIGIVQVQFSRPVGEDCWPGGRRWPFPRISAGAKKGDIVMLAMAANDGYFVKSFAQIEDINDDYIIIAPTRGHRLQCRNSNGDALYYNNDLIGIFSRQVLHMCGNDYKFVRVHKKV